MRRLARILAGPAGPDEVRSGCSTYETPKAHGSSHVVETRISKLATYMLRVASLLSSLVEEGEMLETARIQPVASVVDLVTESADRRDTIALRRAEKAEDHLLELLWTHSVGNRSQFRYLAAQHDACYGDS